MTRTLACLACLAPLAGCGKPPTPAAPAAVDGTYLLVSVEAAGTGWDEAQLARRPEADRKVVIAGNRMTTRDGKAEAVATLKLDPSKTPAQLDITTTGPDGKPETLHGIYQVEGDVLTICAAPGDPKYRPDVFRGEGRAVLTRYRKQ